MHDPGPRMSMWFHFLESLSTTGAVLVVMFTLFVIGIFMTVFKVDAGPRVTEDSFIALTTAAGTRSLQKKEDREHPPVGGSPGPGPG